MPLGQLHDPPPQFRLAYQSLLALRVNPLGLLEFANLIARYRLYESTSAALRDNHVGAGLTLALSPAYARIGGQLEVQPATVLNLWARYEWAGYFGSFDLFQSFASANEGYRDSLLDARGAISVTERASYIGRVRNVARLCAEGYVAQREKMGFPLLKK